MCFLSNYYEVGQVLARMLKRLAVVRVEKIFWQQMYIAYKEARETKYWLRLLQQSKLVNIDLTNELIYTDEIIRILSSIVKTTEKSIGQSTPNS